MLMPYEFPRAAQRLTAPRIAPMERVPSAVPCRPSLAHRTTRTRMRNRWSARVASNRDVVAAWGEYLHGFNWSHFATLTAEFPSTPGRLELHFNNHFIRNLARAARRPVPWFYAMERSAGGILHMHALLANTEALSLCELRRWWSLGFTAIQSYASEEGAAFYVAKSLDQPNVKWERWNISRRILPLLKQSPTARFNGAP